MAAAITGGGFSPLRNKRLSSFTQICPDGVLVGHGGQKKLKRKKGHKWAFLYQVPGKGGTQGHEPNGRRSSCARITAGVSVTAQEIRGRGAPGRSAPQPAGDGPRGLRAACRRPGRAGLGRSTAAPLQNGAEEVSQRHFWAGSSSERHLRHVTTRQTQRSVGTARPSRAALACGQAVRGSQPGGCVDRLQQASLSAGS